MFCQTHLLNSAFVFKTDKFSILVAKCCHVPAAMFPWYNHMLHVRDRANKITHNSI